MRGRPVQPLRGIGPKWVKLRWCGDAKAMEPVCNYVNTFAGSCNVSTAARRESHAVQRHPRTIHHTVYYRVFADTRLGASIRGICKAILTHLKRPCHPATSCRAIRFVRLTKTGESADHPCI
jgi:hypothetical protein